jgi:hypothetical protein
MNELIKHTNGSAFDRVYTIMRTRLAAEPPGRCVHTV